MIDYQKIVSYYSYYWDELPFFKKVLLILLPIKLFITKWYLPNNLNIKYLFIQSMNRNDYSSFLEYITGTLPLEERRIVLIKKTIKLDFNIFYLKKDEIINIWKTINCANICKKLYIFFNIIHIISIRKHIEKYKISLLVTHSDMQPLENYIVQYFKNKNVQTVTLQHGLYIDYSKYPNLNEVNYKSVVSDYFLAWGEETKELIKKYHPQCEVLVCGNPMVKKIDYKPKSFFAVVFDQELFKEYNKKLINIAQQLSRKKGFKILLKLHPKNNLKDYKIDRSLFIDGVDLNDSLFVLGHTTTMIFQLMRNSIPIFKYQTEIPSNKFSDDLIFHNIDELIFKLEKKDKINYDIYGRYYIEYIDRTSLKKYKNVLEKIVE